MPKWLWCTVGVFGGLALARLTFPVESSCCVRVANAARDQIAGIFGDGSGVVKGILDGTGLTNALPGLLDLFGVSKD